MAGFNVQVNSPWLKKLPNWMYKAGAQAWIDKEYPRHLFIETTAACNLTCPYCPREAKSNYMDWSLFTRIVDEATLYGPRSFSLHLFGEPTLYPYWTEAIRYIKQSHRRHTVLLTTNGTTLNARVDDLVQVNPDLVLWSWRPEAKFTPETKAKLKAWGKFRVRFIKEVTPKKAYEEWKDWPNVEGRHLHNYGGNINIEKLDSSVSHSLSSHFSESTRWPCYHLWLAPAVAWNGNILLCCADPHQKEVLGHFPEVSVHEAWTAPDGKLAATRLDHLRGKYKGICTNCDVWKQYPNLFFSWQRR